MSITSARRGVGQDAECYRVFGAEVTRAEHVDCRAIMYGSSKLEKQICIAYRYGHSQPAQLHQIYYSL